MILVSAAEDVGVSREEFGQIAFKNVVRSL